MVFRIVRPLFAVLAILCLARCTATRSGNAFGLGRGPGPGHGSGDGTARDGGTAAGIIGGATIDEGSDLIHSVALTVLLVSEQNRTMNLCTGTFISPDVLLTSAHCVPKQSDPEQIRVKQVTRISEGEFLRVKSFVRHEKYTEDLPYKHDLALVRLDQAPPGVKPLNYHWSVAPTALSWGFLALGYGQSLPLTTSKETDAGSLRTVELQADFYEPDLFYFKVNTSNGKGICHGDSGGPALWRQDGNYILLGVASSIEEGQTGACNLSALYNNVPYYREWIDFHLRELEAIP